jgi:multimeric flavodoxin WrbA
MKAVAINGSPNSEGNTYEALQMVTEQLAKEDIETEIIQVGDKKIRGCTACGQCFKNKDEKCVLQGDDLNQWIQKMKQADGIILGSPVHYSGIAGTMKSFLDRAFFVATANDGLFRHKVGAAVTAVRRSGGIPTFTQLTNYLNYCEMAVATSNYWSVIHGHSPGEAKEDKEGKQIMRVLGKNMAWLMQVVEAGKEEITPPEKEDKVAMNFIR